jgi:hypothetical protein
MKINVTWQNDNSDTIYNRLASKLGRQPTTDEVKAELDRILREVKHEHDNRRTK